MPKAKEIYEYIDSLAPFCKQEEWDNSGFLIGDENTEVKSVLLALDCTNKVLEYAKKSGCELVITHHPIIFGALKQVKFGSEVYTAVNNGLSDFKGNVLFCSHDYEIVNTVANRIIEICDDGVIDHSGNYDDFVEFKESRGMEVTTL